MKKFLFSLVLVITSICASAQAAVVQVGSTYSLYIQGSESGEAFLAVSQFDPVPAFASRAGLVLVFTESETALGNGTSRITINVSADGDLFPILGESAIVGIGVGGDGLDLTTLVSLNDARVSFKNAAGVAVRESGNLAADVPQNDPWDGFFPTPSNAFAIDDVGGQGVSMITFEFLVSEMQNDVPEPASVMLLAIGLLAVGAAGRKSRKGGAAV